MCRGEIKKKSQTNNWTKDPKWEEKQSLCKESLTKTQPTREEKRQWYLVLNTNPPISALAQLSTISPYKNS